MEDSELIDKLQGNETAAIAQLIDRYGYYVARVLQSFLGSGLTREDLEEVTSDVFLAVWNQRSGLQADGNLKAYIATIAKNTGRKRLRRLKVVEPLAEDILLASEEPTPQEQLEEVEGRQQLQRLLGELGTTDREIFYRYYYIEQRTAEIARCMGINRATVMSRLFRGRKQLKLQLTGSAEPLGRANEDE